ncbi:hypothetical protein WJX75_006486 [Coccomyxa subellipsoidea]|uniref:Uncharacterized protein n=1 Tax=Coccomyxa subellipsoidea TaxID=248742 RepID=A0ABR2YY71_9CHLO
MDWNSDLENGQASLMSLCDKFKGLSTDFADQRDIKDQKIWLEALQECLKALKEDLHGKDCREAADVSIRAAATLFAGQTSEDSQLRSEVQVLWQVISFMDAALTAWDTDSEGRSRATLHAGFLASDLGMKRLPARVMAQPSLTAQLVQDILQTCQAFLDLAHGLFFSERWLGLIGTELFADVSAQLRVLLKDHVLAIMSCIITNVPDSQAAASYDEALSATIQKLLHLGAVMRDVLSVLISSTRDAFSMWSLTTDSNNSKVLRFFLQHLAKVLAANPTAVQPSLPELAAMLAELQGSFNRCMEEGDAARAQAMAEAKIALDKVTAELSAWLFAQNDCAVCQRSSEAAVLAAAFAAHCDEVQPTPTNLFNAILIEEHWALQHEAMLALLAFARSPSTDIKAVLPWQLCDAGNEPSGSFVQLLTQYMHRANPSESETDDRLSASACAAALNAEAAASHCRATLNRIAAKISVRAPSREQDVIARATEDALQVR